MDIWSWTPFGGKKSKEPAAEQAQETPQPQRKPEDAAEATKSPAADLGAPKPALPKPPAKAPSPKPMPRAGEGSTGAAPQAPTASKPEREPARPASKEPSAATTATNAPQPSPKPGGENRPGTPTWSRAQLTRLESEAKRLLRAFAYHPHVRVLPLEGNPPTQYQIEYRVRTLTMEKEQLRYANSCSVHVWLPPAFPHEPPLVRPMTGLFHPNVSPDGIACDRVWRSPGSSLTEVVSWVGTMLAFQDYDLQAVYNERALGWIQANPNLLPLDGEANMQPEAGGDPLGRIGRLGPRTIEQLRSQIKQTCDSLLAAEEASDIEQPRALVKRIRQTIAPFTDADIPEELRSGAAELSEWADQFEPSLPVWNALGASRRASGLAMSVARQLSEVRQSLADDLDAVAALVSAEPASDPIALLAALPDSEKLELHRGNLASLIGQVDPLMQDGRAAATAMAAAPAIPPATFTGLLQRRLDVERPRVTTLAGEATTKLKAAARAIPPVLERAKAAVASLAEVAAWREYASLVDRARQLSMKILEWGAAELQAYWIANETGQFGPCELEQPVSLGAGRVAVRNLTSASIEAFDVQTGRVLTRGEDGVAVLAMSDPGSGRSFETRFRLSGNCNELAVQLDYLMHESSRLLGKLLRSKADGGEGWLGSHTAALASDAFRTAIRAEHHRAAAQWKILRDELRSLWSYKERLATLRLLQRSAALSESLLGRLATAEKELAEVTERIAMIVSGSSQNPETGQLAIPQKWVAEYPELLTRRDKAMQRVARLSEPIEQIVQQLSTRLAKPELVGRAERPKLKVLNVAPWPWADVEEALADAAMKTLVGELETRLNTKLVSEDWPAQPPATEDPKPA